MFILSREFLVWLGTLCGCALLTFSKAEQPDWPVAPAPVVVPKDMPGPIATLSAGDWFVVQSDEDVQLLASPPGVVSITAEAGPIRIRGKFADSKGVETRVYGKKQVFIVERLLDENKVPVPGTVELLLVPRGKVERRLVDDGSGPRPPPDPGPKPRPKPPEPVSSFRVFIVFESATTLTTAQKAVVTGVKVEEWLDKNCTGGANGWRRRDKDSPGETDREMAALWKAIQLEITAVPCVAVEVNKSVEIIPLGATPDEMIATLKKYKGVQ